MKRNGKIESMTWQLTPVTGKIAALYVRVSSNDYKKGPDGERERRKSVPLQIDKATAYAKGKGWQYRVYDADCDISAMAAITDRPAITELIADIQAGKIHTVVFRAIDRLFRNKAEGYRFFYETAKPCGVNIVSLTEPIDVTTQYGENMLDDLLGQAQTVPLARAKESRDSKDKKAEEGTLRIRPPLGYQVVEADGNRSGKEKPSETPIVREIFARYLNGEGLQVISKSLTHRGIRGKTGGILFNKSIKQLLTNPIYKGELIYNGKSYGSPYPALIDAETWAKVNALLVKKGYKLGTSSRNKSLLAGILRCGYCAQALRAGSKHISSDIFIFQRTSQYGKPYLIYNCQNYARLGRKTCGESISIRADVIEPFATDWLKKIVENKLNGPTDLTAAKAKLDFINEKLAELEQRKETLAKLVGSGDMDADDYVTAGKALRAEKTSLEADRAGISDTVYREQNSAETQIKRWDSLTVEQKREAIKSIIKAIYVYSDRIVMHHVNGGSNEFPITRGYKGRYEIDEENGMSHGGFRFSEVPMQEATA